MLRMDSDSSDGVLTIRLQGKLLGPWVEELRRTLDARYADGPVRLDLSALSFADASGADLLESARRNGVEFVGANRFVADVLEAPQR